MYLVTIETGGTVTRIHNFDPNRALPKLPACSVVLGASDEIESCSFTIYPDNPGYELLHPLSTGVAVWSTTRRAEIFRGRVLTVEPSMDADGLICKDVVCESEKGYLCDSIQPYTEERHWTGDQTRTGLEEFIDYLLANHNAQVETDRQIFRGVVTVTPFATSDDVTKGTNYETTWACIKDKLIGSFGGEIDLRRDADGLLRLDYVPRLGRIRDTVISLGRNLKKLTRTIDPSNVASRLIPLGATLENSDARVTIADVNGGKIYLEDAAARTRFGLVTRVMVWDDVTEPGNLLTKAVSAFPALTQAAESYSVEALNLYELGLDPDDFDRFDSYRVVAEPLGINTVLRCRKVTVDVVDPSATSADLGGEPITQSGLLSALSDSVAQRPTTEAVKSALATATDWLTNGQGYKVERRDSSGRTVDTLYMDTPDIATARNVLRIGQSGIGFSRSGVNGPYLSAWTLDGSLNMANINVVNLVADMIRGGTLTLGGLDDAYGVLVVRDENGEQIGLWSKNGINVGAGYITTHGTYTLDGVAYDVRSVLGNGIFQVLTEDYLASLSPGGVGVSSIDSGDYTPLAQLYHGESGATKYGTMMLGSTDQSASTVYMWGDTGSAQFLGTITQGSDRRLKSDVRDVPEELIDAFLSLTPRLYTLIASGKNCAGLIAQEVQGTPLEDILVVRSPDTDLLMLDYTSLHALELAAIQRQENRLRRLEELYGG